MMVVELLRTFRFYLYTKQQIDTNIFHEFKVAEHVVNNKEISYAIKKYLTWDFTTY